MFSHISTCILHWGSHPSTPYKKKKFEAISLQTVKHGEKCSALLPTRDESKLNIQGRSSVAEHRTRMSPTFNPQHHVSPNDTLVCLCLSFSLFLSLFLSHEINYIKQIFRKKLKPYKRVKAGKLDRSNTVGGDVWCIVWTLWKTAQQFSSLFLSLFSFAARLSLGLYASMIPLFHSWRTSLLLYCFSDRG